MSPGMSPDQGDDRGDDPGTGHEYPTDIRDSNPNGSGPAGAAGGMGVSSERVGSTGPGQVGTDGVLDVSAEDRDSAAEADPDLPTEQSAGGAEVNPDPPVPPVSGYSERDPRHAIKPYDAPPDV